MNAYTPLEEVDALRAEIERLRGHKEEADRHIVTIAQLRAEIERLTKERDHYLALALEYQRRRALEPKP